MTDSYKEGQRAYNKKTGETLVYTSGQWVKPNVPDYTKVFQQEAPSWVGPAIAIGQGASFNNLDELVGAVAKVHGESYEQARDRVREIGQQFAKENPKTDLTLNVLGSLPQLFAPGGNVKAAATLPQKVGAVLKPAAAYGALTRTQYNATSDAFDLFKLLGFPAWKTNYGRNL